MIDGVKTDDILTQHLLLFLRRSSCQHGGGQGLLSLDMDSRLWGAGGNRLGVRPQTISNSFKATFMSLVPVAW